MKKFNLFLVLAVICLTFIGTAPEAFAAFAEQPATLVVFDRSGNVTQDVYRIWREPVRWAYHFPDFKMVDNAPAKAAAAEKIFTPQGKVKIDANVMKRGFSASMMILTILTLKLLPMRIFMYTGTTATGSPKKKFTSVM